jgi:hypothetical protein
MVRGALFFFSVEEVSMAKLKTVTMKLEVTYDPEITDPDSLASALDTLMETALSTPGILDEYGAPRIDEFFPIQDPPDKPRP